MGLANTYLEAAAKAEQKGNAISVFEALQNEDMEAFMEAMSAMRKLKKFKDVKEARAAIEKDMLTLKSMMDKLEDTIADMVYEVAAILQMGKDGVMDTEDDDVMEQAYDKAHSIFMPLMKGVNSFDFKRVKETIMKYVEIDIEKKHEKESEENSILSDMKDK